jgi:hypothetical protein
MLIKDDIWFLFPWSFDIISEIGSAFYLHSTRVEYGIMVWSREIPSEDAPCMHACWRRCLLITAHMNLLPNSSPQAFHTEGKAELAQHTRWAAAPLMRDQATVFQLSDAIKLG